MLFNKSSCWFAVCLALPLPTLAFDLRKTEAAVTAAHEACEEGYESSGRGGDYYFTGCEEKSYQIWDRALGGAYSELMKALPAPCRSLLRKSQRAWLTYRDADTAAFMASVEVRPGNSYSDAIRKTQRVRDRVELLASLLEDVKHERNLCPPASDGQDASEVAPVGTIQPGK